MHMRKIHAVVSFSPNVSKEVCREITEEVHASCRLATVCYRHPRLEWLAGNEDINVV